MSSTTVKLTMDLSRLQSTSVSMSSQVCCALDVVCIQPSRGRRRPWIVSRVSAVRKVFVPPKQHGITWCGRIAIVFCQLRDNISFVGDIGGSAMMVFEFIRCKYTEHTPSKS